APGRGHLRRQPPRRDPAGAPRADVPRDAVPPALREAAAPPTGAPRVTKVDRPPLTDAQRSLVAENLGLVGFALRRAPAGRRHAEALRDAALDGLISAARAFDPARGLRFGTLAIRSIRDAVSAAIRRSRCRKRTAPGP